MVESSWPQWLKNTEPVKIICKDAFPCAWGDCKDAFTCLTNCSHGYKCLGDTCNYVLNLLLVHNMSVTRGSVCAVVFCVVFSLLPSEFMRVPCMHAAITLSQL